MFVSKFQQVTLSGLLNAVDGLWSCCGEEHIIVFTTNHKERLDPALLRPGRMDKQIHLSYCNFSAFKQLVVNYLCITEHELFEKIEVLLEEVQVTPAEIAEELTKDCDATECLQDLIKSLQAKKMIKEDIKNEENIKEEHELGSYDARTLTRTPTQTPDMTLTQTRRGLRRGFRHGHRGGHLTQTRRHN